MFCLLEQSIIIPASPITSGNDELLLVITGHPQAMASKTGKPNPSYFDVNVNHSAPLYNEAKSLSATYPIFNILSLNF